VFIFHSGERKGGGVVFLRRCWTNEEKGAPIISTFPSVRREERRGVHISKLYDGGGKGGLLRQSRASSECIIKMEGEGGSV